ncbi:unnamed protein product, partial [Prorocentrum cordatum]
RGLTSWGSLTSGGYRSTTYTVGHKKMHVHVHRLVARTFLGPCRIPAPWCVNHKDNDPSNNCVTNLEYVTPAGNAAHWLEMAAQRGCRAQKNARLVWGRPRGTGDWVLFRSCRDAAKQFNVPRARILAICLGECPPDQNFEVSFDADRLLHPVEPQVLPGEEWREIIFDI